MLPRTKFFTIIVFLAVFYLYNQGNTKEQQFKLAVQEIITGFSKQDSLKISKYINKGTGIYYLRRIGIPDDFEYRKTLGFSDIHENWSFRSLKGIKTTTLKYSRLPTYDCEKESWSKKGLFVDTTKIDHILSRICKERNELDLDTFSTKTIRYFYNLENKSRRVVFNDANEKELVFYLTYLNRRWYISIIDTITSDCSA